MTNETNHDDDVTATTRQLLADAAALGARYDAGEIRDVDYDEAQTGIGDALRDEVPALLAEIDRLRTRVAVDQTRQAPRDPRIVPTNEAGELCCDSCQSTRIQELGQIVPGGLWWEHVGQDPAAKVLNVCGWEWEGADTTGFACTDCQTEWDQLPEGWESNYV